MLWDQKTDDSFHNSQNDAPPLSNDQRPRSRPRPIRALEILARAGQESSHGRFQIHVRASSRLSRPSRARALTSIPQGRRLLPSLDHHSLLARHPLLPKPLQRPRHALRLRLERAQHHSLRILCAESDPRCPLRLHDGHASGRQNHVGGRGRLSSARTPWECE
jgi:hypothetical protein